MVDKRVLLKVDSKDPCLVASKVASKDVNLVVLKASRRAEMMAASKDVNLAALKARKKAEQTVE